MVENEKEKRLFEIAEKLRVLSKKQLVGALTGFLLALEEKSNKNMIDDFLREVIENDK